MVMVKATVVDARHLRLSEPLAALQGETVMVSVASPGEVDGERQSWQLASAMSLSAAYGESEPEYPASMIRESNPDYKA